MIETVTLKKKKKFSSKLRGGHRRKLEEKFNEFKFTSADISLKSKQDSGFYSLFKSMRNYIGQSKTQLIDDYEDIKVGHRTGSLEENRKIAGNMVKLCHVDLKKSNIRSACARLLHYIDHNKANWADRAYCKVALPKECYIAARIQLRSATLTIGKRASYGNIVTFPTDQSKRSHNERLHATHPRATIPD